MHVCGFVCVCLCMYVRACEKKKYCGKNIETVRKQIRQKFDISPSTNNNSKSICSYNFHFNVLYKNHNFCFTYNSLSLFCSCNIQCKKKQTKYKQIYNKQTAIYVPIKHNIQIQISFPIELL